VDTLSICRASGAGTGVLMAAIETYQINLLTNTSSIPTYVPTAVKSSDHPIPVTATAVGISVGVAFIVGIALIYVRRRCTTRRKTEVAEVTELAFVTKLKSLKDKRDPVESATTSQYVEVGGVEVRELQGAGQSELEGGSRYELA
jgi:hypothetical protein